jgi:hypothetical protein
MKAPVPAEELYKLEENCRKTGILEDEQVQKMLTAYKHTGNATIKGVLERRLHRLMWDLTYYSLHDPFFVPSHELKSIEQGIRLGHVVLMEKVTDIPLAVTVDELEQHMVCTGWTGKGKTRLLASIADQIIALDKSS